MTGHSTNVSYRFILMQYTGLTDSKGAEVFEGDVIKQDREDSFSSYNTGEVGYCSFRGLFVVRYFKKIMPEGFLRRLAEDGEIIADTTYTYMYEKLTGWPFEVIGNIHENPEFIE